MELQHSIDINCPPEDVFRFIATDHLKNHPRWDPGVLNFRQTTSGPVGVGTQFAFERKMLWKRITMRLRVTDYVPDSRLTFSLEGRPISMVVHMEIEEVANASRLTFLGSGFIEGPALLEWMMASRMGKEIAAAQARIKTMLESGDLR